ncbi:protein stunted [Sitodiplosis mosellana]|uniref:protein stunted n=1 Tax=Sitodiplosis mosellana TaxID=263140 RepID=UPI002444BD0D|nr:protein stunted [Sitodiplosis mosellana]
MSKWRELGLTYVHYSNIAARVLRSSLKAELKADAIKRADAHVKFTKWEGGKKVETA